MRIPAALVALLLTPAAAGREAPPPQQSPSSQRPVFRTGVDLVQVEVVVLDAEGQPVRGLTKDAFALFDRGIKQDIATFAAKTHTRPPADRYPAGLPLDVADNQSAKSDRLIILVLDDLHFRGRTPEALDIVRRVLTELGDSASIGLVTTSGTFGIEVTEDRARLMAQLERFLDRVDPARAKMAPVTSGPIGFPIPPGSPQEIGAQPSVPKPFGPGDLGAAFGPLHAYRTVEDVARMAGANDGRRKAFIWISAGVPGPQNGTSLYGKTCKGPLTNKDGTPASATDYNAMQICGMYDKLFRSSVAVYAVSPGGPTDGGTPLNDITHDTGGFSIPQQDVERGMERLLADLDNYYVLGFYPAEGGRDGYRPIDVLVRGEGLTVRHRLGYHSAGPPPPPKNSSPLGALASGITPDAQLHLRVGAVPLLTAGSAMQVLTTIEVDLGQLPAASPAGVVRDEIQFAVFAVNLKQKKVTRSVGRRIVLDWPPDHRTAGAERFRIQAPLSLPPGSYQLRASAMSKMTEKSGSVYLQIDVPPASTSSISLGGVVVGRADAPEPRLVEQKALTALTLPFAPSLDREFRVEDRLRIFFQVRRPSVKTAASGVCRLLTDAGAEAARVPWRLESGAAGVVELGLPLSAVPPGPYRLVVQVDGSAAAPREVAVRVDK